MRIQKKLVVVYVVVAVDGLPTDRRELSIDQLDWQAGSAWFR